MLASEGKVDFCISLAGMFVYGKQALIEQNLTTLSVYGFSQETVNLYCGALEGRPAIK